MTYSQELNLNTMDPYTPFFIPYYLYYPMATSYSNDALPPPQHNVYKEDVEPHYPYLEEGVMYTGIPPEKNFSSYIPQKQPTPTHFIQLTNNEDKSYYPLYSFKVKDLIIARYIQGYFLYDFDEKKHPKQLSEFNACLINMGKKRFIQYFENAFLDSGFLEKKAV